MAKLSLASIVVLIICCLALPASHACTIFIANDGKNVWVGNNEDDSPEKNYRVWLVPAKTLTEYGFVTWGGILKGIAKNMSDKFPEGGINEYGLFIDAAALPQKIAIKKVNGKKNWNGYVVKDVLKKCKTVDEALLFLGQFNLVEQEKAQIFIADATGNYAVVHANYVIKKEGDNFALTNYCINNNETRQCWRRGIVNDLLQKNETADIDQMKYILEKSAQTDYFNKTNYSIAANLKSGEIHLYLRQDFATDKILNIKEELKKGEREIDMVDLFPLNIGTELQKILQDKGLNESTLFYENKIKEKNAMFNLKNHDVILFSANLLNQNKIKEGATFLNIYSKYQPTNTDAKVWLGIAHYLSGDNKSAKDYFSELIDLKPNDYLVNLYGNQKDGTVTFLLDHFEDAKSVLLAGDFTNWKANAVVMKKVNERWSCTIPISKGTHQYKFVVDDVWVTDPKNVLTATLDNNVNSKLIVW